MEGEDEFSRVLAQSRIRLGYLGFENITNKELILLSHYLRLIFEKKSSIPNQAKEAIEECFFKIVGYHTDQLDKDNKGMFTPLVQKMISEHRRKYNDNDDPSSFE